jgi:cysteine synthase A
MRTASVLKPLNSATAVRLDMALSSRVCSSVLELVGATPLVRLARIPGPGLAHVFAKLEHFNPAGSHKDRLASKIVESAEAQDLLRAGSTVVEASCGSFAVSLALFCAAKGYRLVAVLPRSTTVEHLDVLRAYGASVELTPADQGMPGAIERAEKIAASSPGFFSPRQYQNEQNAQSYAEGLGAELVAQARQYGGIDAFAMTLGTGGTFSGVSRAVKAQWPVAAVAAIQIKGEADRASRLPYGRPDSLSLDAAAVDRTLEISDRAAWQMTQRLAREEGLLVGITSGANVAGALRLAAELGPGKSVYTLCCDSGERYLSLEGTFA